MIYTNLKFEKINKYFRISERVREKYDKTLCKQPLS